MNVFMIMGADNEVFVAAKHGIELSAGQALFFGNINDNVAPEAVYALLEPIVADVGDFLTHLRVVPIEVGLFFTEKFLNSTPFLSSYVYISGAYLYLSVNIQNKKGRPSLRTAPAFQYLSDVIPKALRPPDLPPQP